MCATKINPPSYRLRALALLLGLTSPLLFSGCGAYSDTTYGYAGQSYGATGVAPVAEQYPTTYYGSRNVYVAPSRYSYYRGGAGYYRRPGVGYYGRPAARAAVRTGVRASYR